MIVLVAAMVFLLPAVLRDEEEYFGVVLEKIVHTGKVGHLLVEVAEKNRAVHMESSAEVEDMQD